MSRSRYSALTSVVKLVASSVNRACPSVTGMRAPSSIARRASVTKTRSERSPAGKPERRASRVAPSFTNEVIQGPNGINDLGTAVIAIDGL